MTTAGSKAGSQHLVILVLLLATGILSLPIVAAFLDGDSTEDLIVPVQLVLMAVVGAVVGYLLPSIARTDSGSPRTAGIGAVIGVGSALVGVALFYVLL